MPLDFVLSYTVGSGGGGGTGVGAALLYGSHTPSGQGAVPVAGAGNGTYGEFTVSGGMARPNTSPLSLGDVTIGSTTFTVVPGVTVGSNAELANIWNGTTPFPTKPGGGDRYILLAPAVSGTLSPTTDRSGTVIRAFDPGNMPTVDTIFLDSGGMGTGRTERGYQYEVHYVDAYYQENLAVWSPVTILAETGGPLQIGAGTNSCLVENCTLRGNFTPFLEGGGSTTKMYGVRNLGAGPNHAVRHCKIHDVHIGLELRSSDFLIEWCEIYNVHQDFVSSDTSLETNLMLHNNFFHSPCGDEYRRHADWFQFIDLGNGQDWGVDVRGNIIIQGNANLNHTGQVDAGDMMNALTASALQAQVVTISTGSRTLNYANDGFGAVRCVNTSGTVTINLPSAAAQPVGTQYAVFKDSGGGNIAFNLSGADTFRGSGTVPGISTNKVGHIFIADGTSDWKTTQPGMYWADIMVRADLTITGSKFDHHPMAISTSGGSDVRVTFDIANLTTGTPFAARRTEPFGDGNSVILDIAGSGTFTIVNQNGIQLSAGSPTMVLAKGQALHLKKISATEMRAEIRDPGLQGFFHNGPVSGVFDANIMAIPGSALFKPEGGTADLVMRNNTFLVMPSYVWDANGTPTLVIAPVAGTVHTSTNDMQGPYRGLANVVYGKLLEEQVPRNQHLRSLVIPQTDLGALTTGFGVASLQELHDMVTRDDALAACRAAAGSEADRNMLGATGSTDTNGYYDFTLGRVNAANIAPRLLRSEPADGQGAFPLNGNIRLHFNQPMEAGIGNVEIWENTGGGFSRTQTLAAGAQVYEGCVVEINPANLTNGAMVQVRIGPGVLRATDQGYATDFPGLAAGALEFTTAPAAVSQYARAVADGSDYMSRGGLLGGKTGINRMVMAFRCRATSNKNFLGIVGDGSPFYCQLRHQNGEGLGTGRFTGWRSRIVFDIPPDFMPFNSTSHLSEYILAIDTTAPDATTGVQCYKDGIRLPVRELAWTRNETFDLANIGGLTVWGQGDGTPGTRTFEGVADMFYCHWQPASIPDFSTEASRARFDYLNAGADGSGVTGAQPDLFFHSMSVDAQNRGTAGAFNLSGLWT